MLTIICKFISYTIADFISGNLFVPLVLDLWLELGFLIREGHVNALLKLEELREGHLIVLVFVDAFLLVELELEVCQPLTNGVGSLALDLFLHGLNTQDTSLFILQLLWGLGSKLCILSLVGLQELLELSDLDESLLLHIIILFFGKLILELFKVRKLRKESVKLIRDVLG